MASLPRLTLTFTSLFAFSVLVSGIPKSYSQWTGEGVNANCMRGGGVTNFNLVNRCSFVVWPAINTISGSLQNMAAAPLLTPFGLSPNSSSPIVVASNWTGRFWGRTGCSYTSNNTLVCDNGNCGGPNGFLCIRDGNTLPVTLAEFRLQESLNLSSYDVSLVGGFNLPLTISPSPKSATSLMHCGSPSCIARVLPNCPEKLRVSSDHNRTTLACSSACNAFETDQYCCTGNYSSNSTCTPNNYTQFFKNLCPTAYTYPQDDVSSIFNCPDADFTITFCSDDNQLQPAPTQYSSRSGIRLVLIMGVCTGAIVIVLGVTLYVCLILMWRNRLKREGEPLNILGIGPKRFKYKELYSATKGFNPSELLGQGGQGQVYKGMLRKGGLQIAIKKLAAEYKGGRGMRDLVSELFIISELKHRNLVQLQGWCKHNGELLVVYDYMPKGSLDKLLYSNSPFVIDWQVRYKIICGLSTALLYLHEEGEKRVVHRDVKPSNIMLDANFEAKLGDFGLARIIERDVIPRSTTAAGTIGYIAPEISTTQLPTAESDVFSFGIVALEVACGRPSLQIGSESGFFFLLEKVRDLSKQGRLMEAVDRRLNGNFNVDEMERIFSVGLAATDSDPAKRPTMSQVVAILTKQL